MANKIIASFIQGNAKFAQTYQPPAPLLKLREIWQRGEGTKGAVILSCSDPRVIPEKFLGLGPGPNAVIRNAGGRAMDAMRSLLVLNAINPLAVVVVVHHTDCGTTHVNDDEVRESIKKAGASVSAAEIDAMKFGEITDLETSIKEDVDTIKGEPLFGNKRPEVVGLLYDVETGLLRQVE